MSNYAKAIVTVTGIVAVGVLLWKFYDPPRDDDNKLSGCMRPAQLAMVEDRRLKLAATQFGEIAVGEVDLSQKSAVVDLLSEQSDKLLVFNYLMCEAAASGQYDPKDREQLERVRTINAFLVTNPSPEQFIQLQELLRGNSPQARLVVPDLSSDGDTQVLLLTEPLQTISLLNAGEAEMSAWVRNESPGKLTVDPRAPAKLDARQHANVMIGLVAPPESGPWMLRFGSSATSDEMRVEVRNNATEKHAELLGEIAEALQATTPGASEPSSTPAPGEPPPEGSGGGARWLADRTRDVVSRKYPEASDSVAWAVAGSLLEQMNFSEPAVVAYRASRDSLGEAASELDAPLSRVLVLASVAPDPARMEKDPATVLTADDLDRLGSLKLARSNMLVETRPELADSLSDALADHASLRIFAASLKGDVAMASNEPESAVAAYEGCERLDQSPSCAVRKAEAQVMLKDAAAANSTLSDVAAQAQPGSVQLTNRIARDARRVVSEMTH